MDQSPTEIAAAAIAEHGTCACRELRNELADAAHSIRLDDARLYLDAACIVCGKQRAWSLPEHLSYEGDLADATAGA